MLTRERLAIPLLTVAGFAVVTTEFVVVGILPLLARDLNVSVSTAGLLVTLWAFTVALFGPPLTAVLARVERRRLFVSVLLLFAVANLIAAAAPDFRTLGIARVVAALALPVFWSMANTAAGRIAGPEHEGRAVAQVFTGIALATVVGIPLGTLAAEAFGWRTMFAGIAAVCIAVAGALAWFFPTMPGERLPVRAQAAILGRPAFLAHLGLAALAFTAAFTGYTYLADLLQRLGGFDGHATGLILVGFGAVGLVGNALAGRIVDAAPVRATVAAALGGGVAMALVAPVAGAPALLFAVLALWGAAHAAGFVANSVRVMKAGHEAPAFAMAMNASVCNLGIGLGAIAGGAVIDRAGVGAIGFAGAALVSITVLAAALLQAATARTRPQPAPVA